MWMENSTTIQDSEFPESLANMDVTRFAEEPVMDEDKVHAIISARERRCVPSNMGPYIAEFHTNSYAANAPNEDSHTELASSKGAMFGVFDGHGGRGASSFVRDELLPFVDRQLLPPQSTRVPKRLKTAFREADEAFINSRWGTSRAHEVYSGACAIAGYVTNDGYCYMANTGDCGGFVGTKTIDDDWVPRGSPSRHTADNPTEMKRILQQHPREPDVITYGRLKGSLIPTRAFGSGGLKRSDINNKSPSPYPGSFKTPYLTPEPDVTRVRLQPKRDRFMVLASDGLWELLSPYTVARLIGEQLEKHDGVSPDNLATLVVKKALDNVGIDWDIQTIVSLPEHLKRNFHDDITATVVVFKRPQSPLPSHLPSFPVRTTAQQARLAGWMNGGL